MTGAVLRKELATLWASPVPYAVGAAFHAVLGALYVNQLQVREQAVIQPLFPIAGFLLLFTVPLLTMRSIADESRTGTLDLLLAAGAPTPPIALGKWLAAWLTTLAVIAPATLFGLLLVWWGDPDTGPALSGFGGLALLAAALGGLGLVTSSLSASQPVAAMTAIFGSLALWFAHVGSDAISTGGLLSSLSLSERMRIFAGGGVDTGDVGYFLAVALGGVVVAAAAVEVRRAR